MNKDEALVAETLKFRGYVDVEFEPDGNIPPDFANRGVQAFEVTRLNDSKIIAGKRQSNDQKIPSLKEAFHRLFESIGLKTSEFGFYIVLDINGHSWSKDTLIKLTKSKLREVRIGELYNSGSIYISEHLTLDYIASSNVSQKFQLGGVSPEAIWVGHELRECLKYAISEKARKCKSYKEKYESWHLYLVDYVSSCDQEIISKLEHRDFDPDEFWDTICLVSPSNSAVFKDIEKNSGET
jgi:hypothetical protein